MRAILSTLLYKMQLKELVSSKIPGTVQGIQMYLFTPSAFCSLVATPTASTALLTWLLPPVSFVVMVAMTLFLKVFLAR